MKPSRSEPHTGPKTAGVDRRVRAMRGFNQLTGSLHVLGEAQASRPVTIRPQGVPGSASDVPRDRVSDVARHDKGFYNPGGVRSPV